MPSIRTALLAAALHLMVATVHGIAHLELGVLQPLSDTVFIIAVIYLLPALAALLLAAGRLRVGALVLGAAMLGSLAYGGYHHFLVVSHDHVLHVPAGAWRGAFQITAVLLVPVDLLGLWVAMTLVLSAPPAEPSVAARLEGKNPSLARLLPALAIRSVFYLLERKLGRVPGPSRIAAHHVRILLAHGWMDQTQLSSHLVDARLKSLAQIRAATLLGCPF